jgi:hypothetical protein
MQYRSSSSKQQHHQLASKAAAAATCRVIPAAFPQMMTACQSIQECCSCHSMRSRIHSQGLLAVLTMEQQQQQGVGWTRMVAEAAAAAAATAAAASGLLGIGCKGGAHCIQEHLLLLQKSSSSSSSSMQALGTMQHAA